MSLYKKQQTLLLRRSRIHQTSGIFLLQFRLPFRFCIFLQLTLNFRFSISLQYRCACISIQPFSIPDNFFNPVEVVIDVGVYCVSFSANWSAVRSEASDVVHARCINVRHLNWRTANRIKKLQKKR